MNIIKNNTIGDNSIIIGGNYIKNVQIIEDKNNFYPPYLQEDIDKRYKDFIQTSQFKKALEILKEENNVLLVGFSGIGKTCASEMLADYFVKNGYQLKYLSDLNEDTLKILGDYLNKNIKQFDVIVLDNFLSVSEIEGKSEYTEKIEEFFRHIKNYKNKKFIFNSRKTLIQDIKIKDSALSFILEKEIPIVDFECWDDYNDKINIFILYCKKNNILEQVKIIGTNKIWTLNIFKTIFEHRNFSPLIIDRATKSCKGKDISEYAEIIINYLNNPKSIWEKEIKALNENSYYYLLTLYSLTDWLVNKKIVDECYRKLCEADECLEDIVLRLEALLKKQCNKIGFTHPSLLEYFRSKISLKDEKYIFNHIIYIEQIERLDSSKESIKKLFTLPVEDLRTSLENLKTLPISLRYNDDILDFENSIWIKYLKYMYELKIETFEHQELLIDTLSNILDGDPRFLIHSANDVLNVFALDYDFTKFINNQYYLELLYEHSNEQNIWYLIRLTEEKIDERYDFTKMQDIAKNAILNMLTQISSDIVDDIIYDTYESEIQEYFEYYGDDYIIASDVSSDVVQNIMDGYQDKINDYCNDAMCKLLEKYKIYNADLSEIYIDCNYYMYDFIEEEINKLLT